MELHHLRHLIAVAEELNFRKAASRLNIAQPALSRSIQRLEYLIEAKLFDRSRNRVTLTQAGAYLVGEARFILDRTDLARRLTQRTALTTSIQICVAAPGWNAQLTDAIRAFRRAWPTVSLRFTECTGKVQAAGLKDGRFDLGIALLPLPKSEGLEHRVIRRLKFLAAVAGTGPLAKRKQLALTDLAPYPFVAYSDRIRTPNFAKLVLACQNAGFTPEIAQEAEQTQTILHMVASELGVALLDETAKSIPFKGISFLPVSDLDHLFIDVAAVWVPRMLSRPLQDLLELLETSFR